MQKITPFLWYDKEAAEAAELYVTVFSDSRVKQATKLHDTPSGTIEIVSLELFGQEFTLMSAGPMFKLNPSVSFMVTCATKDEVETIWQGLSRGGKALMELEAYPFSEKYGWVQDRYGLSWQIMFIGERPITQRIIPTLMFVGAVCGKAEEAINFYAPIFKNSQVGEIFRYVKAQAPDVEGTIAHASFTLEGQEFAAMDSAHMHEFSFNEGMSFVVNCDTQEEVDYYWDKLTFDPNAEQCGWLKDQFGLSWQIVPIEMMKMLQDADPQKVKRVMEANMKMKKLDLPTLRRAFEGE